MHILEILTDEMKCTNFFLSIGIIISPSDVYFLSYNGFSGACESAANFTHVFLICSRNVVSTGILG